MTYTNTRPTAAVMNNTQWIQEYLADKVKDPRLYSVSLSEDRLDPSLFRLSLNYKDGTRERPVASVAFSRTRRPRSLEIVVQGTMFNDGVTTELSREDAKQLFLSYARAQKRQSPITYKFSAA
jgi:hypothetical protein